MRVVHRLRVGRMPHDIGYDSRLYASLCKHRGGCVSAFVDGVTVYTQFLLHLVVRLPEALRRQFSDAVGRKH